MALKELIHAIKDAQQKLADESQRVMEAGSDFKVGDLVEVAWGQGWEIALVAYVYGHGYDDGLKSRMYQYRALMFDANGSPKRIRNVFYTRGEPREEQEIRPLIDAAAIQERLAA